MTCEEERLLAGYPRRVYWKQWRPCSSGFIWARACRVVWLMLPAGEATEGQIEAGGKV